MRRDPAARSCGRELQLGVRQHGCCAAVRIAFCVRTPHATTNPPLCRVRCVDLRAAASVESSRVCLYHAVEREPSVARQTSKSRANEQRLTSARAAKLLRPSRCAHTTERSPDARAVSWPPRERICGSTSRRHAAAVPVTPGNSAAFVTRAARACRAGKAERPGQFRSCRVAYGARLGAYVVGPCAWIWRPQRCERTALWSMTS